MGTIIEDLINPELLPDETENVSVVQTHISIVFVTDRFVYKIKKPVNFGFLDFSTLEKRKYFCHQELTLNRRLAQNIYLDVLPVRFDGNRHGLNGKKGRVVDYAVKMRRIPDEFLMKSLFKKGALTNRHLENVAQILAEFHLHAKQSEKIDVFGKASRFRVNTDENFDQVAKYIDLTIPKKDFDAIKQWTNEFYNTNEFLFKKRIKEGRIKDCHGDLHMEHICFTKQLAVIDCIEFNDRFRFGDTIADIAFLLMDLDYHGGQKEAKVLWDTYCGSAGEKDVESLLTFYKVYRAFVRGKVNSFQIDDSAIGTESKKKAVQTAASYFKLAYSYVLG